MLGYKDLDRALAVRPGHVEQVSNDVFERLESAFDSGELQQEFDLAWSNGQAFARAERGLRGRPPWRVEWRGPLRPQSRTIETIPADLRVDSVYLISCKYGSTILHNSSPAALFEHCLAPGIDSGRSGNWYEEVAPTSYLDAWRPVAKTCGIADGVMPSELDAAARTNLKEMFKSKAASIDPDAYGELISEVSHESAARWNAKLNQPKDRAEQYWRLLRLQAAPYYVLGGTKSGEPLRYQVGTPWDFGQNFKVKSAEVTPGQRKQPSVDWSFKIAGRDGFETLVSGFVEVRWSHGKFQGQPEAKVNLSTSPMEVPGYWPLTE